jgi:hypothetical protein
MPVEVALVSSAETLTVKCLLENDRFLNHGGYIISHA